MIRQFLALIFWSGGTMLLMHGTFEVLPIERTIITVMLVFTYWFAMCFPVAVLIGRPRDPMMKGSGRNYYDSFEEGSE